MKPCLILSASRGAARRGTQCASNDALDKEGQVKHTTEIVGQHLVLLGSGKGSTEEATNAAPAKPPNNITLEDNDDGLPF